MKELILKCRKIEYGGFFSKGYVMWEVIRRIDGKEESLGDFVVQRLYDKSYRRLQEIGRDYRDQGFTLLGEWDLD